MSPAPSTKPKSGFKPGFKPSESATPDVLIIALIFILVAGAFGAFFGSSFEAAYGWYKNIIAAIYSGDGGGGFLTALRWVVGILDVLLVIFIGFAIYRHTKLIQDEPLSASPKSEKAAPLTVVAPKIEMKEGWEHIRILANSSNPSDWNMAILRADALVDDALAHLGHEGESFAERLTVADPTLLPSIDRLWSAHRLRNAIAHDPLSQYTKETIIHALRGYEQALKELGMLEDTSG